jgi:outer membrane receptor protein involved in Fe transport
MYDPSQVTLPGLGNSFNVIVYYEKGPIAARGAYNRRDGFLRNPSFCGGIYCSTSEPVFAKSYDQIDARFAVAVTKQVQVYVEGINLGNSSLYQSGRYDNLFVSYENFGRRFTFGATARF